MKSRHLSTEIVSLIHHVSLNESGWWNKAISQVIKGVLWKLKAPQNFYALKQAIEEEIGYQFSEEVLKKQLSALERQQSLVQLPNETFKLSEQAYTSLTQTHQKATTEQNECKSHFLEAAQILCPNIDPEIVWGKFCASLISYIRHAGANLYQLIAGGMLEKETDWLQPFLEQFNENERDNLRLVASAFFSDENTSCRSQVLRLLSAHFFAEATQLSPETISAIEKRKSKRVIKVVLDTNFIFSILGLHDNPADEAATNLLELSRESSKHLDIKLYVLPSTIEEAQNVLANQIHSIERIRATPSIARAAISQNISSIARKFFEAAQKTGAITPNEFFQPYVEDLRTILKDKGIQTLDANPAIYNVKQAVVDDVLSEQEREKSEVPIQRRKSYETMLHDVVLWHAINDRRPGHTDSPFEAAYWGVTIDWRLINFDRKKREASKEKTPVILHPSNLIQLIQFWIPRTQKLEDGLIDALKIPLYFHSFDAADEAATINILQTISRFENIEDFSEDTVRNVLANKALRGKLAKIDADNEEPVRLIREALLSEHRTTLDLLEKARTQLLDKENEIERINQDKLEKEALLKKTSANTSQAEERATAAEAKARELEELIKSTSERAAWEKYALYYIALPIFLGLLLLLASAYILERFEVNASLRALINLALLILPIAISFMLSPKYAERNPSLFKRKYIRFAVFIGKYALLAPLSLAIQGIFQSGVYDLLKNAISSAT